MEPGEQEMGGMHCLLVSAVLEQLRRYSRSSVIPHVITRSTAPFPGDALNDCSVSFAKL